MSGMADILGHHAATTRLWEALARDALHHAYLFEGPEGVGKHTVALRLAMAANCTGEADPPPCGTCPPCQQIRAGNHPDILVLEPAADRATPIISVDQVREVVRIAGYHRYGARRRFILIDPAEAMLDAAANALLKTLEEPLAGTGFILVATHASALLPTVRSRCQRIRFSAVPEEALQAWLEDRGIQEAGIVARASLGCPGRALSLADGQLQARHLLRDRLLAVLDGDIGDIFAWSVELCSGKRQQWRPRVAEVLDIIDDLLRDAVVYAGGGSAPLLNADAPEVVAMWAQLWPDGVTRCGEAVAEAREQIERNVAGRTLMDALLSRVAKELGTTPEARLRRLGPDRA
ncbi:MAG: DNA polymerase III subunit delta' [Deltaproteobacteria bacterium]|nr:DNA polymerase III subunit delta' [Deltaproteobacteria bacterium]MBW2253334.1 DNA polymerase III subunit delta' [Deltaproteobacteria bacterium]